MDSPDHAGRADRCIGPSSLDADLAPYIELPIHHVTTSVVVMLTIFSTTMIFNILLRRMGPQPEICNGLSVS